MPEIRRTPCRRRRLLAGLALASLARPARAQPPQRARVGFLSAASVEDAAAPLYIRRYLAALGWREGERLLVEDYYAEGDTTRLPGFAARLADSRPDVIVVTGGTETRAMAAATRDIPVVFLQVVDPVAAGHVESLARPGRNVTGVAAAGENLFGKRLELLKELLPGGELRRVAFLANPNNPITARTLPGLAAEAARLGVAQRIVPIVRRTDIAPAIAGAGGEDALLVQHDFVMFPARRSIAGLAAQARKPVIYENRFNPMVGGLCSYGADLRENYRIGALYADRILRGAKPADLPVMLPNKLEFVINAQAASEIGLDVPPALMARADEVIE